MGIHTYFYCFTLPCGHFLCFGHCICAEDLKEQLAKTPAKILVILSSITYFCAHATCRSHSLSPGTSTKNKQRPLHTALTVLKKYYIFYILYTINFNYSTAFGSTGTLLFLRSNRKYISYVKS